MFTIAPRFIASWLAIAASLPVALVSFALTGLAQTETAIRFRDIPSHWAAACIEGAGAEGLMSGYGDRTFRPNRTMTRTEFAAVMVKAFPGAEKVRNAPNFADIADSFWGKTVIAQAYERGFLVGYPDNTFRPNQPISRVQAIAILANATNLPVAAAPQQWGGVGLVTYDDREQIPAWANRAVFAATQAELIVNYPEVKQLRPNDDVTRGEATAFLCQAQRENRAARYRVPPQYVANELNSMRGTFAFAPEIKVQSKFVEGLAVVELGPELGIEQGTLEGDRPRYGYINSGGHLVLRGPYQAASEFSEGLAAVQDMQGRWGFIDRNGQWVISPQFENARAFSDGLAFVQRDRQSYAFIRRDGTQAFANPLQGEVGDFSEGLIRFERNGKWGFLDKGGEVAISTQYDAVQDVSEGLAGVTLDGKSGFINLTGETVIPLAYEQVKPFSEGLAAARGASSGQSSDQWGYLNLAGDWAIAPQFAVAQPFSEGLAGVVPYQQTLWGFIDPTGQFVIQPEFYSPATEQSDSSGSLLEPAAVQPFEDQLAVVRLGSGVGLIRPNFRQTGINGEYVRFDPIIFNDAEWASDGLIRVHAGGRWEPSADPNRPPVLRGGGWGYLRVGDPDRLSSLLPADLNGLPIAYAEAVLNDIRQHHGGELPVIDLEVVSITPTTWTDCERGAAAPSRPFQGVCSTESESGWQMIVQSGPVRWVYYLTQPLTAPAENWTVPEPDGLQSLPEIVAEQTMRREANRQQRPRSQYRVHWAEMVLLNNCLESVDASLVGGSDNANPCNRKIQSGWQVQIIDNATLPSGGQAIATYHTTLDGLELRRVSEGEWQPPP